ncbi:nucleotidyltransferase domain-containing protein [Acuticoccus sp. M5D2P5]|uniref:nucleotidyltransferase domain-containing protein n=1 Tax=Acuticoccus kalidii TaxID=2910977 RepID=UPI001F42D236|nr:nucleotidyltransferase domain-containing protein [Acuticoccus kalidii]MCF3935865.1 nucleotidyltransferase domain-containing protein [Acuticoccus kalidii]
MDIAASKRIEIEARLDQVSAQEGVRLLFAVESGSRAWGHPSPDSDYDVRFVYVRPLDWYLSLASRPDVIERPIEDDIDLSGWDVKKALALLAKPNPVLLEWLSSPIRYVWDDEVCARLTDFAAGTAYARACRHHYRRLATRQHREHLEGREFVNLKKYFYVLRPALALRWGRLHPDIMPPMNMGELIRGVSLDAATTGEIDRLLASKAQAKESGKGPRNAALDSLIETEIRASDSPDEPVQDRGDEADALFRSIVTRGAAVSDW